MEAGTSCLGSAAQKTVSEMRDNIGTVYETIEYHAGISSKSMSILARYVVHIDDKLDY